MHDATARHPSTSLKLALTPVATGAAERRGVPTFAEAVSFLDDPPVAGGGPTDLNRRTDIRCFYFALTLIAALGAAFFFSVSFFLVSFFLASFFSSSFFIGCDSRAVGRRRGQAFRSGEWVAPAVRVWRGR